MAVAKKDLLLHLATGKKVYCVKVKKDGKVVITNEETYARAKQDLINDATNNPDAVRGKVWAYISATQRMLVPQDSLVALDIYNKEMAKPENKNLAAEIKKLEKENADLIAKSRELNQKLQDASKQMIAAMKNAKDQTKASGALKAAE